MAQLQTHVAQSRLSILALYAISYPFSKELSAQQSLNFHDLDFPDSMDRGPQIQPSRSNYTGTHLGPTKYNPKPFGNLHSYLCSLEY